MATNGDGGGGSGKAIQSVVVMVAMEGASCPRM